MVDSNYYATDTETGESRPLNQRYVKYSELSLTPGSTCNTLWSWGWNCYGENATDKCFAFSECSPVQDVSSSTTWIEVGGIRNTIGAIKNDGTLWMWGRGTCGQLGNGCDVDASSPVQEFCSSSTWCKICGGGSISRAIKEDGSLWSWGINTSGQLGIGSTTPSRSCSPIQEYTSSTWLDVHTSDGGVFAIKNDNTLWSWGRNTCGELLLGYACTVRECSPVQEYTSSNWIDVSGYGSYHNGIKTNGTLWSWGYGNGAMFGIGLDSSVLPYNFQYLSPVQECTSSSTWCTASSSLYSVYALKTDGTLWAWGDVTANPIGSCRCTPTQELSSSTNWKEVNGGTVNGHAIKTDGTLWSWGGVGDSTGTIGDGTLFSSSTPKQEFYSATNWFKVNGKTYGANALRING